MPSTVAVVTGANKGIGLAIVRALCRHFGQDSVVYLTARNEDRGKAAVELLQKEGLDPKFHLLDVTDQSTIDKLRNYVQKEHGGIDILVNNAGLYYYDESKYIYEHRVQVMEVNFFGVRSVCRSLFPLVQSGGRIVNVASWSGYQSFRNESSDDVKEKFKQAKSEEDVVELMNEFLEELKAGTCKRNGWSDSSYGVSKLGVTLLSKMQAEMITQDKSKEDVLVNACCPGSVKTDMSAAFPDKTDKGSKISPDEGADTPVFLALLPPGTKELNGQFLMRREVFDYINTDVFIPLFP